LTFLSISVLTSFQNTREFGLCPKHGFYRYMDLARAAKLPRSTHSLWGSLPWYTDTILFRITLMDLHIGYWIQDLTKLNDKFGTSDDLKALIAELHKRDMYV